MAVKYLGSVSADLWIANKILNAEDEFLNEGVDEQEAINHAMYSSAQAVEKLLKGIAWHFGETNPDVQHTHNINVLLVTVSLNVPTFCRDHPDILRHKNDLIAANNLRYEGKISRETVMKFYNMAKEFYDETLRVYGKEQPREAEKTKNVKPKKGR